jgi:hypothetical protein
MISAFRFHNVTTTWPEKTFRKYLALAQDQALFKCNQLAELAWPPELAVVEGDCMYTIENLISTALAVSM